MATAQGRSGDCRRLHRDYQAGRAALRSRRWHLLLFSKKPECRSVVNVITTSRSRDVSPIIIQDPRLRKISFTGSTQVGKVLMKQAADNVLRTSMELGGNAPFIVFDDADIDKAVRRRHDRQVPQHRPKPAPPANRVFVQKGVASEFSAKVAERVAAMKIWPWHGRGRHNWASHRRERGRIKPGVC